MHWLMRILKAQTRQKHLLRKLLTRTKSRKHKIKPRYRAGLRSSPALFVALNAKGDIVNRTGTFARILFIMHQ